MEYSYHAAIDFTTLKAIFSTLGSDGRHLDNKYIP